MEPWEPSAWSQGGGILAFIVVVWIVTKLVDRWKRVSRMTDEEVVRTLRG